MICWCCGGDHPDNFVADLDGHPEVKVCRDCIGGLSLRSGRLDVTTTLPVVDMDQSVAFYEAAGFDVHVHGDGGFAFVHYQDQSVFDMGAEPDMDPSTNHAACYVIGGLADEWHALFTGLGYPVTELKNEDYGMREFTLTDPSGNHLRFGHTF
jgi:catechol 2,3-dioxygenase-like lactoylglutathione lyase family enzyme